MLDFFLDALIDSLKVLPFLFFVFLLIEYFESKSENFFKMELENKKKYGALLGAGFGIIPQCGFGTAATKLYSKKYLSIGTLMAIYIATSDEAILLMISDAKAIEKLIPFILIKLIYAIFIGYLFDLVIFRKKNESLNLEMKKKEEIKVCSCKACTKEKKVHKFLWHPLRHSIKIFIYIFVINIILGLIIYYIGEENIKSFMDTKRYLQPIFAIIIGLIPNCASSVLLTQLFIKGTLSFAGTTAGLCANAGIALAVLFKENKDIKNNIIIIFSLIVSALFIGYFLMLFSV